MGLGGRVRVRVSVRVRVQVRVFIRVRVRVCVRVWVKPCKSKSTLCHGETTDSSLNQSSFLTSHTPAWITVSILVLITYLLLSSVALLNVDCPHCLADGLPPAISVHGGFKYFGR